MTDDAFSNKALSYRAASEALHSDTSAQERHGANMRMLWECGLADLIRNDFYGLFRFSEDERGTFLDAGCGNGMEARGLARVVPALRYFGVDISSVQLGQAVGQGTAERSRFFQSALETLPFAAGAFDFVGSHEVVEHVEDPAVVLAELYRVLKPGGVCVIATPNGASLWVEHVRQRLARLVGRRGAPVGEDHTRPPGFWRREFARAGFAVERQIYDGAAFEFLTYVAPAGWMRLGARLLEPLRIAPGVNLLLCDRVKYRLRKPGGTGAPQATEPRPVCPLCHGALAVSAEGAACPQGHRFGNNASGLVDFTAVDIGAEPGPSSEFAPAKRGWLRRLRRGALAVGCAGYVVFLALLVPLGYLVGRVRQPLPRRWSSAG